MRNGNVNRALCACVGISLLVLSSTSISLARGAVRPSASSPSHGNLCLSSAPPDGLVVTRNAVGQIPTYLKNAGPLRRTSDARTAIQRLYRGLCSLRPPVPDRNGRPLVLTCNFWPVEIHLLFTHRGHPELRLSADTGGCPVVVARAPHVFHGATLYFTGRVPFWPLVARATGLSQAALLPYPAP